MAVGQFLLDSSDKDVGEGAVQRKGEVFPLGEFHW